MLEPERSGFDPITVAAPDKTKSAEREWHPQVSPWLIAAAVMLPTFMEVLDTSIASVALPHIAGSFSASAEEATWVLTSYLVANAVILPASGWFALRYGRRNFLLFCIVVFTIASFLCGSAASLGFMLTSRTLQGAAGGALQPLSQAILLESFPVERRGSAMAIFGMGVVVAPILGPTFGGWLTDQYTWRWAFYINVPIGIIAVMMVSAFVSDPPYIREAKPGRVDAIGLGLLAIGLGALQTILDKGQEDDWFGATWIRWFTAIAIAALASFVIRQLKARNPVVGLRVFKDRNFAFGCLLMFLFGAVIYGIVTILPLFYQTVLNYPAGTAGIAVSPRGVGALLIMPIAAFLNNRVDNRWMIAIGFLIIGINTFWMGNLTVEISEWSLLWPTMLTGAGTGLVFVTLATITMATLKKEQIGNATGLFNLLRNVGGSVGISLVNTVISRHMQTHRAELAHRINGGRVFQDLYAHLHALMALHAGMRVAQLRAYALIQNLLDQQSTVYAYVDDLRYMALLCFACAPIIFLVKRARQTGEPMAAH